MIYLLLVVYVFLPIPRKWQVTVLALLLTLGYLALGYYAIQGDQSPYGHQHVVTKVGCVTKVFPMLNYNINHHVNGDLYIHTYICVCIIYIYV